jgi:hypothetical protein
LNILAKKIYCTHDKRLVRGKEEKSNGNININCSICGKLLRVWNRINWKTVG